MKIKRTVVHHGPHGPKVLIKSDARNATFQTIVLELTAEQAARLRADLAIPRRARRTTERSPA